jgi:branched-chain amino acid transport system ATP-binding protein
MPDRGTALLRLEDVHGYYGESHVIQGVFLEVPEAGVVSIIGRNGVGKTTTLRCITGLVPPRRGRVIFDGRDITGLAPHVIARLGIALVPEERRIFGSLTVAENIQLAAEGRPGAVDDAIGFFPALREYLTRPGDRLSGGEQQMLAIARALVARPRLVLVDEPLEGLAPLIAERIQEILESLRGKLTVLVVEQNVRWLLRVVDHHYIMNHGRVVFDGSSAELAANPDVIDRYLGVST